MGLIQRSISYARARRVPHFTAAYLAGCWVVLEVLDHLVGNQILPQLVYQLALLLVLTLAPGVVVVAWFHGEKGAQKVQPLEKWSLAGVATVALVSVWLVYRGAAPVVPEEGGPAPSSIAVLYFEDLSPDGSLEYVAAGLTEGLIDKLSRVPGLSVVSRNGMARYRGTDISRDSIARALDTGSLVAGGVERVRERLRVTVRLVDGLSGACRWMM